MKRLVIVVLNLILIIIGFLIVRSFPWSALAITLGMLMISASIISFAVLIYFPPPQPGYVKLKVVEETPKTASRTNPKPKRKKNLRKKPKRIRK
jgi:hypothetical protein